MAVYHRYPIAKLEVKDPKTGEWIIGKKTNNMWNYWQFNYTGSGLTTPYEIRITDQYGQVIEETGNSLQEKFMWEGTHQFPVWGGTAVSGGSQGNRAARVSGPGDVLKISGGRLFRGRECDATIVIADISGRNIARIIDDRSTGIVRLPHLPPALYYVKISPGRSAARTLKWVSME